MTCGMCGSTMSADEEHGAKDEQRNDNCASNYTTDNGADWARSRGSRARKVGMTGLIYFFRFSWTKSLIRPSCRC